MADEAGNVRDGGETMNRIAMCCLTVLWIAVSSGFAQETAVPLPSPRMSGGKPLAQCLKERRTQRVFSGRELPDQLLSDLLWSADGVNRPDGHTTAPSAMNMREIDIYVAKADGLYRYDAEGNSLIRLSGEDIRVVTGQQEFVRNAPVNLIYVADEAKMGKVSAAREKFAAADTGFIAENVYLFCASEGLATVVRGSFDEQKLSAVMKLRPDQKVILCQSVGYPQG